MYMYNQQLAAGAHTGPSPSWGLVAQVAVGLYKKLDRLSGTLECPIDELA